LGRELMGATKRGKGAVLYEVGGIAFGRGLARCFAGGRAKAKKVGTGTEWGRREFGSYRIETIKKIRRAFSGEEKGKIATLISHN